MLSPGRVARQSLPPATQRFRNLTGCVWTIALFKRLC